MILIKDRHLSTFHFVCIQTMGTMILIKDRHPKQIIVKLEPVTENYDTYKGSTRSYFSRASPQCLTREL